MRFVLAQTPTNTQQTSMPINTESTTPQTNVPPEPSSNRGNTSNLSIFDIISQSNNRANSNKSRKNAKYQEYQSTCRSPEDQSKILSTENAKASEQKLLEKYNAEKNYKNFEIYFNSILEQKKFTDAKRILALEKSHFTNSEQTVLESRVFYFQKNYRSAVAILEKYLADKPEDILALLEAVKAYKMAGNLFEAKSALQDVIKLDKSNYTVLIQQLCALEVEDSNHTDAITTCNQAIKANPQSPDPITYLGISERESQNLDKAEKLFLQSISLKPTEFAFSCLAEIYALKNDYDKTLEFYKKSFEENNESPRALNGLALTYYQKQNYQEALNYFVKACKIDKSAMRFFRSAYQTLENAKVKISNDYYQAIQKCNNR
ncbi:MAG: tetratricopeptide repeat protein [Pseudobdellovibrio sp.]